MLLAKVEITMAVILSVAQAPPTGPTSGESKPPPEPAWKTEFRKAYGLKEGEVLKRMAVPFPACRLEYCKSLKLVAGADKNNFLMNYRWDGKNVEFWSFAVKNTEDPYGWALLTLLGHLGIPRQEIDIDEDLQRKLIEGEFVLRTGTPVWADLGPARVATQALSSTARADVVIVGAGITGALVAEIATARGLSVILLDRRPPFHGSTAASTALLQFEISAYPHGRRDWLRDSQARVAALLPGR